jgi:hypothetical protein
MKTIITLLLTCIIYTGFGKSKQAYEKLCEVNKCWTEQPDVYQLSYPEYDNRSEREWIRTHLTLVEQTLRARSTAHLSEQQKANRLNALAHLNQYWHEGNFPVNDQYKYRTPIFIDKYDNFCAVGYLVKATGFEQVSRKIAATTNLAYVREMNYPELFAWASDYGFTVDELAWIQPGYPYMNTATALGKGTDGEVFELYTDKAEEKLYVGGNFMYVDGSVAANNIAYVTEQDGIYTWHKMGSGLSGTVYAITEFNNKIYAAGSFSAGSCVAYWDGTAWQYIGCIGPVVKDLIVYNNELYAVGDFNVCAALSEVNFAKWNGTSWQQIPGLEGHVNTVHNQDNTLVLGGNYTYMGEGTNIIKWTPAQGFAKYAQTIANEVNDIEEHGGWLYAACKSTTDTNDLLRILNTNTGNWDAVPQYFHEAYEKLSFNSLCIVDDKLYMGGDFYQSFSINAAFSCMAQIHNPGGISGYVFAVDSAINVVTSFKNMVVAGGKFDSGAHDNRALKSIASRQVAVGVKDISAIAVESVIFPNPVKAGGEVIIENNIAAKHFRLYDVTGKLATDVQISADNKVLLPQLPPGIYIAELSNINGEKGVSKLVVE